MLGTELENNDVNQVETLAESADVAVEESVDARREKSTDNPANVDIVADESDGAKSENSVETVAEIADDNLNDNLNSPIKSDTTNVETKPAKGKRTKKTTTEKEKTTKEQKKKKTNTKVKEETVKFVAKEPELPKGKDWYILKVQVNREDTIKKHLERRAKIAGLEEYFGDILVPMEKITEIRNEKKRVVRRKLYPGYIMINMEINDDTWFLVRETPGIGDFTGAIGKPTPMLPHEVQRMLAAEKEDPDESPKLKVGYSVGDQIKIKEGSFESLNGIVDAIDYASGRVTVIVNLFGRSTPVELEYWQIEQSTG
ncbi:MAG: transcription termination/antitermination protein NusG [Planctomycetaceae bacterium]|jgi:transcriptional antiterminator NusG|nr:transcription termination/antitermination protein NusG [Planctomycetaceae bacterium]